MGLALCSRGTTLGKGTLRMYPSWSVPTTTHLTGHKIGQTLSDASVMVWPFCQFSWICQIICTESAMLK